MDHQARSHFLAVVLFLAATAILDGTRNFVHVAPTVPNHPVLFRGRELIQDGELRKGNVTATAHLFQS
ncbi:MAG: hypothetical protein ACI9F9_001535, partial [Candidatus Paceibacteria bacterium]